MCNTCVAQSRAPGLRRPSAVADKLGQRGQDCLPGNVQAAAEIVPEGDALFGTGPDQAEEGIATIAPDIAAGTAARPTRGYGA